MRICIIRHASFPEDPRVRKEVDALLGAGHEVDVLCLQAPGDPHPAREQRGRLTIIRMPFVHRRASVASYVGLYLFSLLAFGWRLTAQYLRRDYDLVQVNTMPDALVFCTLLVRFEGVPVVLDVHEPTPELWVTKYGEGSGFFRWLQDAIQRLAVGYASHVTTVSEALRERLLSRARPRTGITVVPNSAPLAFADGAPEPDAASRTEFRLVTHGAIEERYGHELVIRAVCELRKQIPNLVYEIIGSGSHLEALQELVVELDCEDHVRFKGFLSFDELRSRLRGGSLGVVPMRWSPYSELIDTNKMYELMLLGVPVLHSRLPVVEANFGSDSICFFEPDEVRSLLRQILHLWKSPEELKALGMAGQRRAQEVSWDNVRGTYVSAITNHVSGPVSTNSETVNDG